MGNLIAIVHFFKPLHDSDFSLSYAHLKNESRTVALWH